MTETTPPANRVPAGKSQEVDAPAEWRSTLTGLTGALLLFLSLTGFSIYFLPFSIFNQFSVILHTVAGLAMLIPVTWFVTRHWLFRKKGNLSHYQLLGYTSLAFLVVCIASGLVLTWQGIAGPAIGYTWDLVHLVTGIGLAVFVVVHLAAIIVRKVNSTQTQRVLRKSQWHWGGAV